MIFITFEHVPPEMIISKLESNTIFSGNYRTKNKIVNCIDDNKKERI